MQRQGIVRLILVEGGLAALAGAAAWVLLASAPVADESVIHITYPYMAGPERVQQIRAGFQRVKPGATMAQVTEVLGVPDEVHPLYEPKILRPRRIGTTYWYFLAKPAAGSNMDARVVRVAFDLDRRVSGVDHWGLNVNNGAEATATPDRGGPSNSR